MKGNKIILPAYSSQGASEIRDMEFASQVNEIS